MTHPLAAPPDTARPPIIAVDVDQVVADLHTEWLRRYNATTGHGLTKAEIDDWDLERFVPVTWRQALWGVLHQNDLYDDVAPIPGALAGVNTLRELGYRVAFVTQANPDQMGAKLRWLQRHGFLPMTRDAMRDYFVAADKATIAADVLVDDAVHNVTAFPGLGVLFNDHHNTAFDVLTVPNVERGYGWAGVVAQVQAFVALARETDPRGLRQLRTFDGTDWTYSISSDIAWIDGREFVPRYARDGQTYMVATPTVSPAPTENALEEASRLIYGDRNSQYGHPADNFQHTADLVNAMLGGKLAAPLSAEDIGFILLQVKVSRDYTGGPKRDTIVDIAGYAGCVQRIRDRAEGWE